MSRPTFIGHRGDAIVIVGLSVLTKVLLRTVEVKAACSGLGLYGNSEHLLLMFTQVTQNLSKLNTKVSPNKISYKNMAKVTK